MSKPQSTPRTRATVPPARAERDSGISVIVTGAMLELVLIMCMAAGLLTAVVAFFVRR